MELGIGTDDELIIEGKDRSLRKHQIWSPKYCEPDCLSKENLMSPTTDPTSTEHAQILSYQADFLYGKKRFDSALPIYRKGVAIVPIRYVLLRRIFIEGAARCCVHMGEHEEALCLAALLLEESLTWEHRMTAHSLLASVHAAAGNQPDAIKSLHICIQWQRSNIQFWLRLAEAYSALYHQSQLASHQPCTVRSRGGPMCTGCLEDGTLVADKTSVEDLSVGFLLDKLDNLVITEQDVNSIAINGKTKAMLICTKHRSIILAASCLLRARLLLKSVEHSVYSFAKLRNNQLRTRIQHSLETLHLHPAIVSALHQHARIIFRQGCHKMDEEAEGGASVEDCLSKEEFEQRWFLWLLVTNSS